MLTMGGISARRSEAEGYWRSVKSEHALTFREHVAAEMGINEGWSLFLGAAGEGQEHCFEEYLKVQGERLMIYVIQLHLDHLVERHIW